jgi:hypothetical protein
MTNRDDRRARMSVTRYQSAADAARDDPRYWLQIPEAERVLQVWHLSVEQWRLRPSTGAAGAEAADGRAELPNESRLSRSITRISRR